MPPQAKFEKACIEVVNGDQAGNTYEVLFNPAQYSIEKGNQYQTTNIPGLASPVSQFVSGNADTLSLELMFDTYTKKQVVDVRKHTGNFAKLVDIDAKLHAPPVVKFIWGKLEFKAIIEKFSQRFTLFLRDGIPVRATVSVTFKEYTTIEEQLAEIGRKSADRTTQVVFKEGDSLWMLAARYYDDAGAWRRIADENNISNPRFIEIGRELTIPPLD